MKRQRFKPVTSLLMSFMLTASVVCSPIAGIYGFAAEEPAQEDAAGYGDTENSTEAMTDAVIRDEGDSVTQSGTDEVLPENEDGEQDTRETEEQSEEPDTSGEGSGSEEQVPQRDPLTENDEDTALQDESAAQEDTASESDEGSADGEGLVPDQNDELSEIEEAVTGDSVFRGKVSAAIEGQEVIPDDNSGMSSDDLFAEYVEECFGGQDNKNSLSQRRTARSASASLSGIDRAIYDKIAGELPAIATGERASTVFDISVDELGLEKTFWTAEELGVASIFDVDENGEVIADESGNATVPEEVFSALHEKTGYDLSRIISALVADHPYQLYWYEKTLETGATDYEVSAFYDEDVQNYVIGIVGSFSISFPVAEEYSAGDYTIDTSIGESVRASVDNANAIVSKYSSETDYDKLHGYMEEICGLVSYNEEAAAGGVSYGNPWQMIWVFDEDASTNVVCEGYAKAFKYLCDQSDFSGDISCITVTGTMTGGTGEGPHMWNIVNMEDGKNYLVDVTNCDEGTVGEPDELFLAGHTSGDIQNGYTFRCGEINELHYAYDENTLALYSASKLAMGDNIVEPYPLEITKHPRDVRAKIGQTVSLHVEVNDDVIYQWQWSEDAANWTDYVYEGYDSDTVSFIMEEAFSGKYFRCAVTRGDETVLSNSAMITLEVQQDVLAQGLIGQNITWTIDYQGNLIVDGYGTMYDYTKDQISPIGYYSDVIKHISISDGITHIGDYTFFNQNGVDDVITIPHSIRTIGDHAFSECSAIGFLLPEGLVSIGKYAFKQSVFFKEITVPNSVQEIGEHAFDNCLWLENVHINAGLTKICEGLFKDCVSLRSVEIPETVTAIGDEAFKGCSDLLELSLPDSTTSIGKNAFENTDLSRLKKLPKNLVQIGENAFRETNITEITIPDGVTAIPGHAFEGADLLRRINLPESLSEISTGAFIGCDSLKTICIPESVSNIGEDVFPESCTLFVVDSSAAHTWAEANNHEFIIISDDPADLIAEGTCGDNVEWKLYWDGHLVFTGTGEISNSGPVDYWQYVRSIEIGSGINEIRANLFTEYPYLTDVYVSEDNQYNASEDGVLFSKDRTSLICYPGSKSGNYSIPSGVTIIGDYAFYDCAGLTTITFNEGLNRIGIAAFAYCDGLTELRIPDSVDQIEDSAFAYCHNLAEIYLPQKYQFVEGSTFAGCTNLARVVLPDSVRGIRSYAFNDCVSLVSVSMPKEMEYLGESAFKGCSELAEIIVPEGVDTIYQDTFRDCSKLEAVSLPSSLVCIKDCVFRDCASLKSITIPDGVTSIGLAILNDCYSLEKAILPEGLTEIPEDTFWNCKNLKDVALPETLIRISSMAFAGCESLEYIELPSGLEEIRNSCFSGCVSLKSISIPNNTSIEGGLFIECKNLQNVHLPDKLDSIPDSTFFYCESLESVNIPDTVTHIGQQAFSHCYSLKHIQLPTDLESIGLEAFNSCRKLQNIVIPDRIENISYCCFYKCSSLESIKLPASLKQIEGWAFNECTSLIEVIIPEGTESIDERAFQLCTKLGKIFIPESVSNINYSAFAGSNIAVIYGIPDSNALMFARDLQMQSVPVAFATIDHVYYDWEIVEAATCTEAGSQRRTCAFCGDEIMEEIPAKGHTWSNDYTVDREPTCTEEGLESIHCSVCGEIREGSERTIEKLPHSYGEWETVKEATCEEAGSRRKVCTTCGEEVTEEIPATGHDWTEWTVVREASEEEEGLESRTCRNDGSHTEERAIPKLTHVHELEKTEAKQATCTEDGNAEYWTCSKCGRVYADSEGANETSMEEMIIHAIGHSWDAEYTVDREPTCTEEGSESIHCSVCGEIREGSERTIEKLPHSYGEWETVKEATCTETGTRKRICTVCGDEETEEIPATGHTWNEEYTVDREPMCTEEGSESIHCSACGEIREGSERAIEKLPHSYGEWENVKEATCTETGTRKRTCAVCGNEETEKIAATGHTWNEEYTVDREPTYSETGSKSIHCGVCDAVKEGSEVSIPKKQKALGKTTRGDMFNLANSVKVTWKEVPGAKYYKVYREGITDKKESPTEPVIVTERLIGWDQQPGLTNGHAYRYRIVASLTGKGDPSGDSTLAYTKVMYRLKTVVIRTAKNTAPGKVTVKYDKTTSGDSYVFQYCERQDMVGAKTKVVLGANNTSYTISGLKKGKTYYISIRVRKKVNGIDYYTTFGVPKKVKVVK